MNKKIIVFSFVYIFLLLFISGIMSNIDKSEKISDKILRFHILANSDSVQDQELKIKVRDEVLKSSNQLYGNCNTLEDALNVSKQNLNMIEQLASETIIENGYSYNANAYLTKEYFNTRVYDNFTLPAGIYDSIKIEIGEAKGHNWWCVVYPTVCLSGCTDDFDSCLTEDEKEFILNDKYIIKFKIVEIYEKLKLYIKKEA